MLVVGAQGTKEENVGCKDGSSKKGAERSEAKLMMQPWSAQDERSYLTNTGGTSDMNPRQMMKDVTCQLERNLNDDASHCVRRYALFAGYISIAGGSGKVSTSKGANCSNSVSDRRAIITKRIRTYCFMHVTFLPKEVERLPHE